MTVFRVNGRKGQKEFSVSLTVKGAFYECVAQSSKMFCPLSNFC